MAKKNGNGNGEGKEVLNVTLEPELICIVKELAYKQERSVSHTVSLAIKTYLQIEEGKDPEYWKQRYAKVEL